MKRFLEMISEMGIWRKEGKQGNNVPMLCIGASSISSLNGRTVYGMDFSDNLFF